MDVDDLNNSRIGQSIVGQSVNPNENRSRRALAHNRSRANSQKVKGTDKFD